MPRIGMGMPIAAPTGRAPALSIVDNGVFEQIVSGEITPEFTTTRTNLTIYSQDVSQSTWTKSNVAVDGTAVEAPNNTTTAQAITGSANTSSRKTSQTTALTAGLTYTYSAYVKAVAFSHVRLSINDGTVEHTQDFNITNASNGSAGAASNVLRSEIEKLDNNWFRVMLTIQCQNSNSDATYGVLSMAANNTPNVQVAVGGTVLMHVWGQQFEQDIQANAYIATSNTTKTAATALVDVNSVWDFDGTDLVVEADPSDEGFWEAPDNIVLNGDYEELGSELVTNGDFSLGTASFNEQLGVNFSVTNGVATIQSTGANSLIHQTISPPAVTTILQIEIDVVSFTGDRFNVQFGGNSIEVTTTGKQFLLTSSSRNNNKMDIAPLTNETVVIRSISIKQVDPNDRWSLGTGWSIEDGTLIYAGTTNANVEQAGILTANTNYELTYTVVAASGDGDFKLFGETTSTTNSLTQTVGTHTKIFFTDGSNGTDFGFRVTGKTSGSFVIDNVTVREYAITPLDV